MTLSTQPANGSNAEQPSDVSFAMRLSQRVEEERRRIVGVLHDSIGAALVAARLKARYIQDQASDGTITLGDVERMTAELVAQLNGVYDATRGLIKRLRPEVLEVLGLDAALEELVRSYDAPRARVGWNRHGPRPAPLRTDA